MINEIINNDCLTAMKQMADSCCQFAFFDPPYNKGKKYDGYADNMPQDAYIEWISHVVQEVNRLSKYGMAMYLDGRMLELGLYWLPGAYPIIVHKRASGFTSNNIMHQYHVILTNAKPTNRILNLWNDIRLPGEGYLFNEPRHGNPGLTGLALTEKVVENFTYEEEIVLDPFSGTGTTAVACVNLDRNFLCIEQSKSYCDIAHERINDAWKHYFDGKF